MKTALLCGIVFCGGCLSSNSGRLPPADSTASDEPLQSIVKRLGDPHDGKLKKHFQKWTLETIGYARALRHDKSMKEVEIGSEHLIPEFRHGSLPQFRVFYGKHDMDDVIWITRRYEGAFVFVQVQHPRRSGNRDMQPPYTIHYLSEAYWDENTKVWLAPEW